MTDKEQDLFDALRDLVKQLRLSRFRFDIKKDFSLMVADSMARTVLFKSEED